VLNDPPTGDPVPLAHIDLPTVSVTVAASLLDLALGIGVLIRPYARTARVAMVFVTVLYLGEGSSLTPSLWLDPLGPFVKSIPAAVLAAVAAMFMEDR
jgi:DoxX-like family